MDERLFHEALLLAEQRQHVLISTTDARGVPHIASVGSFTPLAKGRILLSDWNCSTTEANLMHHPLVAIVVWDIVTDTGYQFIGEVEAVQLPGLESSDPISGDIQVRVDEVVPFSHAPHRDLALRSREATHSNLLVAELPHSSSSVYLYLKQQDWEEPEAPQSG